MMDSEIDEVKSTFAGFGLVIADRLLIQQLNAVGVHYSLIHRELLFEFICASDLDLCLSAVTTVFSDDVEKFC